MLAEQSQKPFSYFADFFSLLTQQLLFPPPSPVSPSSSSSSSESEGSELPGLVLTLLHTSLSKELGVRGGGGRGRSRVLLFDILRHREFIEFLWIAGLVDTWPAVLRDTEQDPLVASTEKDGENSAEGGPSPSPGTWLSLMPLTLLKLVRIRWLVVISFSLRELLFH